MTSAPTSRATPGRPGLPGDGPVPPTVAAAILARARALSPDPFPDLLPAPDEVTWHYAPGELELGTLHHLVAEGRAAGRHVDYPLTYAATAGAVTFRCRAQSPVDLVLSTSGHARLTLQHPDARARPCGDGQALHTSPVALAAGEELVVTVEAPEDGAAALGVHDDAALAWEVRTGTGSWSPTQTRRAGNLPPHAAGEPTTTVVLQEVEPGLFAAPVPVLGHVVIRAGSAPTLVTGESVEEACATPPEQESRFDLVPHGEGAWVGRHRLGLRFASVTGADVTSVHVEASVRPAPRRGAFVCDDARLDQVWASSALTLRLCMQSLMVDGIKRDRMPWIGDIGLSLASNAYAFADPEVVRASIRALGSPRSHLINGISDYSLWWVISHDLHHLHFDDAAFLAGQADAVDSFLGTLAADVDERGVLRPRPDLDAFPEAGPGAVLIDWGVTFAPGRDPVALQVLWYWALRAAGRVLGVVHHPGARRWERLADRVLQVLRAEGWSGTDGAWRTYLDGSSAPDPYATLLAVHAGLFDGAVPRGAVDVMTAATFRTPFMRTLALRALGSAGHRPDAVRALAADWGPMLDAGSVTFWEEFPRPGHDPLSMYGRPYGKSLCHGWASGPAAALPELVLGLVPLEPGWRTFTVDPDLGDLGWAAAVVPLGGGDLTVVADRDGLLTVDVPAGHALSYEGSLHHGPGRLEIPWG